MIGLPLKVRPEKAAKFTCASCSVVLREKDLYCHKGCTCMRRFCLSCVREHKATGAHAGCPHSIHDETSYSPVIPDTTMELGVCVYCNCAVPMALPFQHVSTCGLGVTMTPQAVRAYWALERNADTNLCGWDVAARDVTRPAVRAVLLQTGLVMRLRYPMTGQEGKFVGYLANQCSDVEKFACAMYAAVAAEQQHSVMYHDDEPWRLSMALHRYLKN